MKPFSSTLSALCVLCLVLVLHPSRMNAETPEFTLSSIDGKTVSLSSLQGKKVLIDFFATWCPPCRTQLKIIDDIVKNHQSRSIAKQHFLDKGVNPEEIFNTLIEIEAFVKKSETEISLPKDLEKTKDTLRDVFNEKFDVIWDVLQQAENDSFQILCVSVDNSLQTAKRFIEKKGYGMTVLFDDQNVAGSYGVRGIPSLFLINENGDIAWQHVGIASKEELQDILAFS